MIEYPGGSAGQATADRLALESLLAQALQAPALDLVESLAVAALEQVPAASPALTAASRQGRRSRPAQPFGLGTALRGWAQVAQRAAAVAAENLPGGPLLDRYLATVRDRADDAAPAEVFAKFSRTLAAAPPAEVPAALDALATPAAASQLVGPLAREVGTAALGFATLERLAALGRTRKRWISHHDHLTRPTHLAASGQTVPIEQAFIVGGWALMVPGDPAAPAMERSRCRCVLIGLD